MIMAIGILSLILVLALSFTAASLFSRKLARLSEDLTCARQFCETGLQRIISSFKTELSDYTDYSTFFPGTRNFVKGSGAWADFYYFLSVAQGAARMTDGLEAALSYSVNGLDYFPNTLPGGVDSSWLALFEQGNRGGVDTNLICGRFAYLVVTGETTYSDPTGGFDDVAVSKSVHRLLAGPIFGVVVDVGEGVRIVPEIQVMSSRNAAGDLIWYPVPGLAVGVSG